MIAEYKGPAPWPRLYDANMVMYSPPPETFYLCRRGSHSHGTFIKATDEKSVDDVDLMGFVFGSREHYFGLQDWGYRGTKEVKQGEWDVVLYEARKAVSLLLQGNPNILSMLWVRPMDILLETKASKELIANRHLFVGKHVYAAFAGYAQAQAKKMETRDPGEMREYLAVTAELKSRGQHPNHRGVIFSDDLPDTGEARDAHKWSTDKLKARLASFQKKGENIGYMGDKRKQLVLEHGYDCKNLSHLIRLLRMCIEFLKTGELEVHRHDAAELIDIKRGKWTLEQGKKHAEELFAEASAAHAYSKLPESPDRERAEKLLIRLVEKHLQETP